jgi:LysM repeat protein
VGSFATSADAINNAINTQFSSARLLSDRQMGGREFSSSNNSNQYKVQAGDTFWGLAKADLGGNASEAEIQARTQQYLAANEGVDPLGLQVGQGVVIPGLVGSDNMTLDEIVAAGGIDLRNLEVKLATAPASSIPDALNDFIKLTSGKVSSEILGLQSLPGTLADTGEFLNSTLAGGSSGLNVAKTVFSSVSPDGSQAALIYRDSNKVLHSIYLSQEALTESRMAKITAGFETAKLAAPLSVIGTSLEYGIYDYYEIPGKSFDEPTDFLVDAGLDLQKAIASAAVGALAGSVVPGLGTVGGFIVGFSTAIIFSVGIEAAYDEAGSRDYWKNQARGE